MLSLEPPARLFFTGAQADDELTAFYVTKDRRLHVGVGGSGLVWREVNTALSPMNDWWLIIKYGVDQELSINLGAVGAKFRILRLGYPANHLVYGPLDTDFIKNITAVEFWEGDPDYEGSPTSLIMPDQFYVFRIHAVDKVGHLSRPLEVNTKISRSPIPYVPTDFRITFGPDSKFYAPLNTRTFRASWTNPPNTIFRPNLGDRVVITVRENPANPEQRISFNSDIRSGGSAGWVFNASKEFVWTTGKTSPYIGYPSFVDFQISVAEKTLQSGAYSPYQFVFYLQDQNKNVSRPVFVTTGPDFTPPNSVSNVSIVPDVRAVWGEPNTDENVTLTASGLSGFMVDGTTIYAFGESLLAFNLDGSVDTSKNQTTVVGQALAKFETNYYVLNGSLIYVYDVNFANSTSFPVVTDGRDLAFDRYGTLYLLRGGINPRINVYKDSGSGYVYDSLINLDLTNTSPQGIWIDRDKILVSDAITLKVYAYDHSGKHLTAYDFGLNTVNVNPGTIYGFKDYLLVHDTSDGKLYGYWTNKVFRDAIRITYDYPSDLVAETIGSRNNASEGVVISFNLYLR